MKANISRSEFATFLRYNDMHEIAESVKSREIKHIDDNALSLITHEIQSLKSQLSHALYKISLLQEREFIQNRKEEELHDAIKNHKELDDIFINTINSLNRCDCHGEDHDYDNDIEGGSDNE